MNSNTATIPKVFYSPASRNLAQKTGLRPSTTTPNGRTTPERVGALPGGVGHLVPAVITIKSATGEIATYEEFGTVKCPGFDAASF
jgi:hypothetical protein